MKRQRTLLSLLSVAMIITLLAGCTPKASRANTEQQQIIVLWHSFTGTEADALQDVGDRFNETHSPAITLIVEYQQDILAKLKRAAPEHRPDLVVVWPGNLDAYAAAGFPFSLDGEIDRADLLPMASALYTKDGKLRALPLGVATYLLYYNEKWLGDLDYNPAVGSWEDFQQAACAATEPESHRVGVGIPLRADIYLALLAAGGTTLYDAQGFSFADVSGIATAGKINSLLQNGCGVLNEERDSGIQKFKRNSMAMLLASSLRLPDIEWAVMNARNFPVGVSPLPGTFGPGATLWYGPGLISVAPPGARHAAALEVLTWFYSPEAQQLWGKSHYVPARRSVVRRLATRPDESMGTVYRLALQAADEGSWQSYPAAAEARPCRAALIRAFLAFDDPQTMPEVYLTDAVRECNHTP